jgi:hypothetical protein
MFVPHREHTYDPPRCYGDSFTSSYVEYARTSQETHLSGSTACYGDGLILLYVDDIRTSLETRLWASTACYRGQFHFSLIDICYVDIYNKCTSGQKEETE